MSVMQKKSGWTTLGLAAFLVLCIHRPCVAADDAARTNQILLSATSPFEDMVGPALSGDDAGLAKMLADADGQAAGVKGVLPAAVVPQFEALLASLHKSVAAKDHYATADGAVQVFKLLVDNVQPAGLKIPKEVSLLDYAGFKLQVLASSKQPDWDAMRKTAAEAAASWNAIKAKVTDKRVRDTVNSTIAGMEKAVKIENLPMVQFAAQIDLDLVDVLEGHF